MCCKSSLVIWWVVPERYNRFHRIVLPSFVGYPPISRKLRAPASAGMRSLVTDDMAVTDWPCFQPYHGPDAPEVEAGRRMRDSIDAAQE